ncbi:hypothetical protein AMTRI_Chr06g176050 [Amborella trichopoda]
MWRLAGTAVDLLVQVRLWDLAVALLGLFIFSGVSQRLRHKGPIIWPFLGVVPSFILHIDNVYAWATNASRQSGGTFSYRGVSPGRLFGVVTVDPANLEYILKSKFKKFPKGKYYRERFSDFLGDGIFNADDDVWKEQRRVANAEMHSSRFVEFSFKTIEHLVCNKLLKLTEKLAVSHEMVDLQDVFLRFTFDNICMAAFGVDPGCLGLDLPDVPFARAFEQATELTLFRFLVPPFVWKPMKYFDIGTERRLREVIKVVHKFAEKTVSDRKFECQRSGGILDRSDLLTRLIQVRNDDNSPCYSDKFLKDFCISFILAGRDTSSVALAWFFWLLHEHPHIEDRILDEIRAIIKRRNNLGPEHLHDVIFTADELKQMEYLHAALSESLRLYPSVPIDFKEVLEDDILPNGTPVKKGAKIIYSVFSMARIESIWGKDCCEFKPERWMKDGAFVSENQFKYAVFNAGPRLCVGKKFAYTQMKMVAASILLRYSVHVVKGHPVVPKLTTTLYMKHGLLVTFHPRVSTFP